MTAFLLPRQQIENASGTPYSGAKAYFYRTLTSTPRNVYTTSALSVAHAFPVVADSAGRWAPIFLDTDEAYKVVITDTNDVEIFSQDPWVPPTPYNVFTTLNDITQRIASNPVYWGALGDGVADES